MSLTPEFQLMVVFISSPLALLVALWGMTPKHTLRQMRLSRMNASSISAPLRPSSSSVSSSSFGSGGVSMHDSLTAPSSAAASGSSAQRPGR